MVILKIALISLLVFLPIIYAEANSGPVKPAGPKETGEVLPAGPKPAYVKSTPVKLKWIPCKKIPQNATGQKGRQFAGLAAGAGAIGAGLSSVFAIISSAVSAGQGLASLIREGKDLAELFGISKKENAILIDNRCNKSMCELRIRCYTAFEDMGWFDVEQSDGTILKFITYLPNSTPFNIGVVNWKCDYEDKRNRKRVIGHDAYGGASPRQLFNLFEARDKGIWHMDMATGRIDIRQKVAFW